MTTFCLLLMNMVLILVTAGEEGGRISTNVDGAADFINYSFMLTPKHYSTD